MKKVLLRIFSAILALVCLFGAWACGVSVKDELDCKEIWKEIREEALANFDLMDAGIAELAANSDVYADGVGTYEPASAPTMPAVRSLPPVRQSLKRVRRPMMPTPPSSLRLTRHTMRASPPSPPVR